METADACVQRPVQAASDAACILQMLDSSQSQPCWQSLRGKVPVRSAAGACVGSILTPSILISSPAGLALHQADGHLTDMSLPASWYPAARAMRRHIIAHCGPTNSGGRALPPEQCGMCKTRAAVSQQGLHHAGKTHAALQALKQASSGLYCGPLRLLAWEVSERLNQASLPCNLITGAVTPS